MPGCMSKSWNTPTVASRYAIRTKSSPPGGRRPDPVCCEPLTGPMAPTLELNRIVKLLGNHRLSLSQLRQLANLEPELRSTTRLPTMNLSNRPVAMLKLPYLLRRELTPRRLALWKAVQHARVQDLDLREIARQLGISRNTVRKHARAMTQPINRPHNHGSRPLSQLITKRSD